MSNEDFMLAVIGFLSTAVLILSLLWGIESGRRERFELLVENGVQMKQAYCAVYEKFCEDENET